MRDEPRRRLARAFGRVAGVEGPLLGVLLAIAAVPRLVGAVAPWQPALAGAVAVAGVGVAVRSVGAGSSTGCWSWPLPARLPG